VELARRVPAGAQAVHEAYIRRLDEIGLGDVATAGRKAANLGALARQGFPVPPGVVVAAGAPDEALADSALEALEALGDGPVAVRSSALAEDLDGASFAGQYETVLGVSGAAAVLDAVRRVRDTAHDERVAAYRQARGPQGSDGIAVLVQRMVASDVSGVAFTAHPLTGAREETVVTATRGLGEVLVGGEAAGEQWIVRDGVAVRDRRAPVAVLREQQALAVAELARRVETAFDGVPQDIEWAFAEDRLYLLQARPMTALPDPVRWESPLPGGWMRNFRIGEWLPEPVTPLFDSWLLPRMESRYAATSGILFGVSPRLPLHVTINGWYFHAPMGAGGGMASMLGLFRRPRVALALLQSGRPEVGDRVVYEPQIGRWRDDLLPRYRALVERRAGEVETADERGLIAVIDDIGDIAGEYLQSISLVGGNAWKVEGTLARFYARHLRPKIGGSHQSLVSGLEQPRPVVPHAIQSLDWFRPTAGELGLCGAVPTPHAALVEERMRAEEACRAALSPALRAKFDELLALAQKYARVREEQVSDLTLGWPLMRRALARLGEACVRRGVIGRAEDVFFLERSEVEGRESRASSVTERRELWARDRKLSPPLVVGALPKFVEKMQADAVKAMRAPAEHRPGTLGGMPASAGRATGVARVLLDLADADRLAPGEILVTYATTPAWTPLFARAAAVATDGGSIAAHASLVAREYGIPAVVALGDATQRIRDGQTITVDGSAGLVEVHG
jgi:phosphohistidine swiveling domain-containing protein